MKIAVEKLPKEVQKIFKIFGSDIRLVGGCARDLLLKKPVNDFDFATKLLPDQTIKILEKNKIKAVPTGLKYGTITAVINKKNFEITTLRRDENQRGRATDVVFCDDYKTDAQRRDFTINAIYIDNLGQIYDYFDGIKDLRAKKLRFIGEPELRIKEDFLRILRFFRFSLEYAKTIDAQGLKACILYKENLKKLSRERIRGEFLKIFNTKNPQNLIEILQIMQKKKILAEIFSAKIQLKKLENLLKIEKSANFPLKLAVSFLTKKSQIDNFSHEICATNHEKKFLSLLFKEKLPKLDKKSLNVILAFYDNEFAANLYLFHLASKPNQKPQYLKYLKNFEIPNFPFSARDAQNKGLEGKEISNFLKKHRTLWAQQGFPL